MEQELIEELRCPKGCDPSLGFYLYTDRSTRETYTVINRDGEAFVDGSSGKLAWEEVNEEGILCSGCGTEIFVEYEWE